VAIVLDTSTAVARSATGPTVTSSSFTFPNGSIILALITADGDTGSPQGCAVTTSGMTWTKAVERNGISPAGSSYGAYSGIFWTVGDGAAHTITATMDFTKPVAIKPIFASGCGTSTPIGATGNAESASSNVNTGTYTSTVDDSQGVSVGMDWGNGTTASSSDSFVAYQTNGLKDGMAVWKAATTTTAGTSVSFNYQMVSGPNWMIVSVELLPAAAGDPAFLLALEDGTSLLTLEDGSPLVGEG
jgi:hypothetical protein